LLSTADVLPTIMGLAGLETKIPAEVEGVNFAALLKNPQTSKVRAPESLLLMLCHSQGVLTDRCTLCINENKKSIKELRETYIYDNMIIGKTHTNSIN
jgi:hypothetical protein